MLIRGARGIWNSLRSGAIRNISFKCGYSIPSCNYIMTEQAPTLGELPTKKLKLETTLGHLKGLSKVVADTANFNEIQRYLPEDSTTNPSLLLQVMASTNDFNVKLLEESIQYATANFNRHCKAKGKKGAKKGKKEEAVDPVLYSSLGEEEKGEYINLVIDHLSVSFGVELLKKLPGYVSTEVDASLSFDKEGTIERAKRIIALYSQKGIDKDRVLIKIASTWFGIKAAQALKRDKINCNMTLIFNLVQAAQCAESDLFLISPFVGRILDWNKKTYPTQDFSGANDPGVKSVTEIYNYFKFFKYDTIVMAASFRNTSQILQLAGCDRLTISPSLLKELDELKQQVDTKLSVDNVSSLNLTKLDLNEKRFNYLMNKDAMAVEKLAEGIRKFDEDTNKLRDIIRKKLEEGEKGQKGESV